MKYKVGGSFYHRHPGGGPTIVDIDEDGKYHLDVYPEDSHPEEELDQWVAEGWLYYPPEYFEKKLKEEAFKMLDRIYPESQREAARKEMSEFFRMEK